MIRVCNDLLSVSNEHKIASIARFYLVNFANALAHKNYGLMANSFSAHLVQMMASLPFVFTSQPHRCSQRDPVSMEQCIRMAQKRYSNQRPDPNRNHKMLSQNLYWDSARIVPLVILS